MGNNVYASASLLPLLDCFNAYSYLYFNDSIAARLCLRISILRWVSLRQVSSLTWFPSPTFWLHFWGYPEFDSVVGEKARRYRNMKDEKSLYFVTAWRYFTEIWNVLRLQIWKHHSNSYPLQLPGIISLDCTLWSKLIPGTCIREQHVWKWLSLWPAHGKQMFSKRFDGIPGSSQSVHNLSFQTYHPPTPVHAQPHEMILQNPLCLFMPPLISALAIFITQNIVWTPVSPSSPAKSLLIF